MRNHKYMIACVQKPFCDDQLLSNAIWCAERRTKKHNTTQQQNARAQIWNIHSACPVAERKKCMFPKSILRKDITMSEEIHMRGRNVTLEIPHGFRQRVRHTAVVQLRFLPRATERGGTENWGARRSIQFLVAAPDATSLGIKSIAVAHRLSHLPRRRIVSPPDVPEAADIVLIKM